MLSAELYVKGHTSVSADVGYSMTPSLVCPRLCIVATFARRRVRVGAIVLRLLCCTRRLYCCDMATAAYVSRMLVDGAVLGTVCLS